VQQQHDDRPVAGRGVLGGTDEIALLILVQRTRRGLRKALTRHDRRPEADEAVEVIGRGEGEVHRARRPTTLTFRNRLKSRPAKSRARGSRNAASASGRSASQAT
jgi:hypothetical protein